MRQLQAAPAAAPATVPETAENSGIIMIKTLLDLKTGQEKLKTGQESMKKYQAEIKTMIVAQDIQSKAISDFNSSCWEAAGKEGKG